MIKEDVIQDYQQTHSLTTTARTFKISPQRVHQIVTGYRSSANSINWGKLPYATMLYQLVQCEKCGKRTEAIHHRDRNFRNNDPKNLMPVCRKCHYEEHKKIRRAVPRYCIDCNVKLLFYDQVGDSKDKHAGNGRCRKCKGKWYYWNVRIIKYPRKRNGRI